MLTHTFSWLIKENVSFCNRSSQNCFGCFFCKCNKDIFLIFSDTAGHWELACNCMHALHWNMCYDVELSIHPLLLILIRVVWEASPATTDWGAGYWTSRQSEILKNPQFLCEDKIWSHGIFQWLHTNNSNVFAIFAKITAKLCWMILGNRIYSMILVSFLGKYEEKYKN